MKTHEILSIHEKLLKTMSDNGIKLEDYKYIQAYDSFINMRGNKVKYRTAIEMLSRENHVSERTLERVIKRLSKAFVIVK